MADENHVNDLDGRFDIGRDDVVGPGPYQSGAVFHIARADKDADISR